jgi:hypothetical protein
MADRPILMSAPMVRALIDGRKTQTRRIDSLKIINDDPSRYSFLGIVSGPSVPHFAFRDLQTGHQVLVKCRFTKGDRLWVRETLRNSDDGWFYDADKAPITLPANHPKFAEMIAWAHHKDGDICVSIHMPRWASRLTLTVTDVRVQRLRDISEGDAEAEGIESFNSPTGGDDYQDCWRDYLNDGEDGWPWFEGDPIASYRSLWESINGAGSWAANPWVCVVQFSLKLANIDAGD